VAALRAHDLHTTVVARATTTSPPTAAATMKPAKLFRDPSAAITGEGRGVGVATVLLTASGEAAGGSLGLCPGKSGTAFTSHSSRTMVKRGPLA